MRQVCVAVVAVIVFAVGCGRVAAAADPPDGHTHLYITMPAGVPYSGDVDATWDGGGYLGAWGSFNVYVSGSGSSWYVDMWTAAGGVTDGAESSPLGPWGACASDWGTYTAFGGLPNLSTGTFSYTLEEESEPGVWPITVDGWIWSDWWILGFGVALGIDTAILPCWWLTRFVRRVLLPPHN